MSHNNEHPAKRLVEEFNDTWKGFYKSFRLRHVVEEQMGPAIDEFLKNLTMYDFEMETREDGMVGGTYYLYTYRLYMETRIHGKLLKFRCEHLNSEASKNSFVSDDRWVGDLSASGTSLTLDDAYQGYATLSGTPLYLCHESLMRQDEDVIQSAFRNFDLVGLIEQHRKEMIRFENAETRHLLLARLANQTIRDVQIFGESYVLELTDGTRITTEPGGLMFKNWTKKGSENGCERS